LKTSWDWSGKYLLSSIGLPILVRKLHVEMEVDLEVDLEIDLEVKLNLIAKTHFNFASNI